MMNKLVSLIQRPKLQLRWKLLGGFGAAILLLVIALAVSLVNLNNTTETLDRINNSAQREAQLTQIKLNQEQALNTAMEAIFTGKTARILEFDLAVGRLNKSLEVFAPRPDQAENYKLLKQQINDLNIKLDRLVEQTGDGVRDLPTINAAWGQINIREIDSLRELFSELLQKEKHDIVVNYELTVQQANGTMGFITVLAVLALLLAIGLASLMTAAFVEPLDQLRRSLAKLAEGDLTAETSIRNRDEFGELGKTYNQTVGALATLVRSLYSESSKVNGATAQLIEQANVQVTGSSQQASAIAEAALSVRELSATAEEITGQALRVSNSVTECLREAENVRTLAQEMTLAHENGRATVARTVAGIDNLRDQLEQINAQQQALLIESGIIGQVIGLLENIARNTHLLSLNAAIEAAGAGQYGERFGVVAHEIKELARNAAEATGDIRHALSNIAVSVEEVTRLGQKCLEEAEVATEDADVCDQVLLELNTLSERIQQATSLIVNEVEGSAALAAGIGASTKQQQTASYQMLDKMQAIDTITNQNLQTVKLGELTTQNLSLTARQLAASAESFKLKAA
jgi:methyl-accepting chemotaxis protein